MKKKPKKKTTKKADAVIGHEKEIIELMERMLSQMDESVRRQKAIIAGARIELFTHKIAAGLIGAEELQTFLDGTSLRVQTQEVARDLAPHPFVFPHYTPRRK